MTPERPRHDGACSTTAVLPCPFCGSAARLVHPHDSSMGYVLCDGCYASSMPSDDSVTVRLWNTRPTLGSQEGEWVKKLFKETVKLERYQAGDDGCGNYSIEGVSLKGFDKFCEQVVVRSASYARTIEALRAENESLKATIVAKEAAIESCIRAANKGGSIVRRALKEHPNG